MDCLNLIEDYEDPLPESKSNHGLLFHKGKARLFLEHKPDLFMKVRIGGRWEFVPLRAVRKLPNAFVPPMSGGIE